MRARMRDHDPVYTQRLMGSNNEQKRGRSDFEQQIDLAWYMGNASLYVGKSAGICDRKIEECLSGENREGLCHLG